MNLKNMFMLIFILVASVGGAASDNTTQTQFVLSETAIPTSIIDYAPDSYYCSICISESQEFYIEANQNCTFEWYVNEVFVQTTQNSSTSNFTFGSFSSNSSTSGIYYVKVIVSNQNETYQQNWKLSLHKITLRTNLTWELKDGYVLTPSILDTHGDKALISLSKNGEIVDQHIVPADTQYYYNRTLNGSNHVVINASVLDIFQGQVDALIVFDGIEQYSDAGTLDTEPTKLLELGEEWNLGNDYSVKATDINENGDYCLIVLDRNSITVDERIMDYNGLYIYQRREQNTNDIVTILELPILNTLDSSSTDYAEFSNNYSLSYDADTVDIDPFLLVRTGNPWNLDDNYSITVEEISEKKALITLERNGSIADREVILENSTYNYNRSNSINDTIHKIITINTSKIFDGNSEDYIEFYPEYQINSDTGTASYDDNDIITAGELFELDEGYELNLISLDINADKAFINLTKNGQLVDEHIVKTGEYYYFNRYLNGSDQNIISFLLDNVFSGEANKLAIIKDVVKNPDIITGETNITIIQKDAIRIRGPVYTGTSLEDIIGNNSSDFIEMNASDFAGFFYDLDKGVTTESLKILGGSYTKGSTVFENGTVYTTTIKPIEYKSCNLEGYYSVIGLLGESYVPLKPNKPNKLAPLLVDSDEKIVLMAGEPFELPNGYVIEAKQIDVDGEKVWIELSKDGEFVEDEVVDVSDKNGETWIYDEDVAGEDDVIVMEMNITSLLQGESEGYAIIEGLWLMDFEDITIISAGNEFGEMQVSEIGSNYLKMTNPSPINLTRNSYSEIVNGLSFKVEDDDDLEFYIMKEVENTNASEVRGTVADNVMEFEWTPANFEGFYHDFDGYSTTEALDVTLSSRNIAEEGLVYETIPVVEGFEHEEWGEYEVVGFLGEKYLAKYTNMTEFDTRVADIISIGYLSKVLIDNDDRHVIYSGSTLNLGEGYELEVNDINTSSSYVSLSLSKNGTELENTTVYEDNDYTYKTYLPYHDNVTTITVHFNNITIDAGTSFTTVKGMFQIADNCLNVSNSGTVGMMEITAYSSSGITMKNRDEISLIRGMDVNLTDNLYFKVADSDAVRFYPFVKVATPPLRLDVFNPCDTDLESNTCSDQIFDITTNMACNFTWLVNSIEVQANCSCTASCYSYSPVSAGLYNITVVAGTPNENIWQTWNLNVTSSASNSETSASSGSSSGSGGGSGGTTGEMYENILKKEVKNKNVNKGMETSYHFEEEANAIESIKFISLKNAGQTSATIEVLKDRSSFADRNPSGEVYQHMNIWIGKIGFATPDNIEHAKIQFKVEKAWIKENDIVESSIYLCRYHDDAWNKLTTKKLDEDEKYIYFESETPGFSPFAITGNTEEELKIQLDTSYSQQDADGLNAFASEIDNSTLHADPDKNTPGMGFESVVTLLALAALIVRKRD